MENLKYFFVVFLIIFSLSAKAQQNTELTLEKCRQMAVENSESIKIAEQTVTKAQSEKQAAKSAWLPNISASATGMYNKNDITIENMMLPTKVFDPMTGELVENIALNPMTGQPIIGPDGNPVFNTYAYLPDMQMTLYGGVLAGVTAEQPLYAGGKIIAGNKMAEIGESMAVENKKLTESQIKYKTDKAYYLYLSVKEKVKLVNAYKELLEQLVKRVNDSYETGMVNRNDLLKVQVKYNEVLLQKQQAESGLKLAKMSLCQTIGIDIYSEIEINDSIGNIAFAEAGLSEISATNRPEYRLMKKQVEMSEQNIKIVKGDYLPTAGVSVGYNYFNVFLEGMNNYDSHGLNAIASIKIPITNFGKRKNKINSAKIDYSIKQLELEQNTELLQLEIEQAKLNLIDAYTRIEITEKALEQANENLRVSNNNYELGMTTISDLLEAQAQWQKAYTNKIDAQTDFKIKESNLKRVSNTL